MLFDSVFLPCRPGAGVAAEEADGAAEGSGPGTSDCVNKIITFPKN